MKKDLEKIGLVIKCTDDFCIKLYFIKNPDGSPRWMWNAENPKPDFLRFYAVSSLRSLLFSFAVKVIFFLKLQHLIFRKNSIKASQDNQHVLKTFTDGHFSLFTGTPGPNRKLVLFANDQFIKIGLDETSIELLNNENTNLRNLVRGVFFDIPDCRQISDGIIALSDLGKNGKRTTEFTKIHAAALSELYHQEPSVSLIFAGSEIYQTSIQQLESISMTSGNQIPDYLKEKLLLLTSKIAQKRLAFNWTHRDFTPWNCFESIEKIKIYDFELAHPQLPFGFDAFHFVLQQGILVDHLSWQELKPLLNVAFNELKEAAGIGNESFEDHLQAYLLINTSYHIDLYSRQEQWHEQIHWLLNTWNDGLSDLLQNQVKQRTLVIGDVFDFLHNGNYAAIKFPNIPPKTLSENTDIDLLVSQKTANNLYSYLKKHSLVKKVQLHTQSKMMSLLIVLHNDQLLALDLIWQLKVKALDFMDVKFAIQEAEKNDFGIKVLNQKYTLEYLRFFYGLNASTIPEKYHPLFESSLVEKWDYLEMKRKVKNMPANKGFAAWVNTFYYITDVARQLLFQKGMIITFSGVDGAGKSTVIEHTKKELEKRLRKKVVVIRHRPSLLPILSAITQGKQKAEEKAANTLPRQGQNKNLISSLLRFGYYYTDYLFGQYYVYAKHVLRGEIVLYDRYYFDFINDGLRSNICLPKWLTKAGYKLLLKPHLNFFLYADAETILSRKKELDEKTITSLTKDYLGLFAELDRNKKGKYFPIKNLQLHDTMTFITSKTQTQLI
jgi:thymidylate kinase